MRPNELAYPFYGAAIGWTVAFVALRGWRAALFRYRKPLGGGAVAFSTACTIVALAGAAVAGGAMWGPLGCGGRG